jgi:hypothetical protein
MLMLKMEKLTNVTLKADLDYILPPFHVLGPHGQPPWPQRVPAYQHRQERQQVACAAAGNAASHTEEVSDTLVNNDELLAVMMPHILKKLVMLLLVMMPMKYREKLFL